MKNIIITFLLTFILIGCADNNKNIAYDLEDKNVIFLENDQINNPKARKLFNNGLQEIRENNIKSAKTLFDKANEIEKNSPIILNGLANYEFLYGDKSSSYQILNKVLEIDSSFILTYTNLGQNYMKDKNYQEASNILKKGLKYLAKSDEHQKSMLYLNLAIASNNLNDCENGLEYGKNALKHSQNSDFSKLSETIIKESKALCEKK